MLNLPQTTEFNKRIPKQKFYENMSVTPALKRVFVEQIKSVKWANKIAVTTTNLSEGEFVNEIEVFHIVVNQKSLDENVFKQIDKAIPYHILYVLEYNNEYQLWIAYKVLTESGKGLKTVKYYHTEWLLEEQLSLKIEGFSLDAVYESFVRQVAGDKLEKSEDSLEMDILKSEQRAKLQKEIARLEKQARAEKQPKKKFELVQHLNKLKQEINTK